MSFGKLYEQTFTGSMMGAGPVVFSVWAYVVAHLRPPGTVEINPRLLSAVIGASVDQIASALDYLTAADPHSRSKEQDGRRLIREGEFLFSAPNFQKYRNGLDEERRAANAARQAAWRDRNPKKTKKPRKDRGARAHSHTGPKSAANRHAEANGIDPSDVLEAEEKINGSRL